MAHDAGRRHRADACRSTSYAAVLGHNVGGGTWWRSLLGGDRLGHHRPGDRGAVLSVREQEFVEAARALGASDSRIIFRHLLPNVTGTLIVQATLDIATAILAEAGLSYIGLGIHAPDTSLGVLAQQSQNAIETRPWLFYFPCVMIVVICYPSTSLVMDCGTRLTRGRHGSADDGGTR